MIAPEIQSCIDACNDCAVACDYCAASCLKESDITPMARCIALDMDCAAMCRMASGYMARGSEMTDIVCQACMELCNACADECSRFQMEHCQECAQACRRCADECKRMLSTMPVQRQRAGVGAGATAH